MKTHETKRTLLMIAGMRDNACRQKLLNALELMPGVKNVDVNLYRASATIDHESSCDVTALLLTIEDCGYVAQQVVGGRSNGRRTDR